MDKPIEINYDLHPHARGHEKDVVVRGDGKLCYRTNTVIRYLVDAGSISINDLWNVYSIADGFSLDDMLEFYRLIGYPLEGFEEIWHEKDPATCSDEEDEEEDDHV